MGLFFAGLMGTFLGPCLLCDVSSRMGEGCCFACCCPGALLGLRIKLRVQENIQVGSPTLNSYFVAQRIISKVNDHILLGRVVRNPVYVNPSVIIFSCLKTFFTSNVWCSLRLLQLKTEGQTV